MGLLACSLAVQSPVSCTVTKLLSGGSQSLEQGLTGLTPGLRIRWVGQGPGWAALGPAAWGGACVS